MRFFYYATLIAMTILWEAPHQPEMGQELVAHTIVNRSEQWGMNLEAVVMQRGQYAGWTEERRELWLQCPIEHELLLWLPWWCMDPVGHLDMIHVQIQFTNEHGWRKATASDWWRVWWIAATVMMGKPEPEGYEGVTYFDNPRFWDGGEPPWAEGKECLGRVGDHVFYR